jgi:hypothetical protein
MSLDIAAAPASLKSAGLDERAIAEGIAAAPCSALIANLEREWNAHHRKA